MVLNLTALETVFLCLKAGDDCICPYMTANITIAKQQESGIIEEDKKSDKQARFIYDNLSIEERIEVISRGQNTKKPVFSYDRDDNNFSSRAQKIIRKENIFDVIPHGSTTSIEFFKQDYLEGNNKASYRCLYIVLYLERTKRL